MFTLSWPQLLVVAMVVLVVFGSGRLPGRGERLLNRGGRRAAPPADPDQGRAEQP